MWLSFTPLHASSPLHKVRESKRAPNRKFSDTSSHSLHFDFAHARVGTDKAVTRVVVVAVMLHEGDDPSPSLSASIFSSSSSSLHLSLLQTGFLQGKHQTVAHCVAASSSTEKDLTRGESFHNKSMFENIKRV